MSLSLECKKAKRTGFIPAFLCGGILAAAVPIVNMVVRSSLNYNEGTYVKEVSKVEEMLVRGVARDNNIARISICEVKDAPGKAFQIFSLLSKKNINVDVILQSIGRAGTKDISFTTALDNLDAALSVLNENLDAIGAKEINHSEDVSKVSIVGAGMVNNPGVATLMFEALYDANINIHMISTSEVKISVLIPKEDSDKAVRAIHDKFNLGK